MRERASNNLEEVGVVVVVVIVVAVVVVVVVFVEFEEALLRVTIIFTLSSPWWMVLLWL
jgi:hypothetical protein